MTVNKGRQAGKVMAGNDSLAKREWTSDDGVWVCREYEARALMHKANRPPIGTRVLQDMEAEGHTATLVWKRKGRSERPWIFIAPSAVLRRVTPIGQDAGLGMYAWHNFAYNEAIGEYTGTSLGVFDAGDVEAMDAACHQLPPGQADKVMELERPHGKLELIDGATAGAPYLPRANDARGLRSPDGTPRRNTAIMDAKGSLRSLRNGLARVQKRGRQEQAHAGKTARWPRIDVRTSGWEELAGREILWAYGNAYWKVMLGDAGGGKRRPRAQRARTAEEIAREAAAAEEAATKADDARNRARRERAARKAMRAGDDEEGDGGTARTSAVVQGVLVGERGEAVALTKEGAGTCQCLFVTELVVHMAVRRARTAVQMIAHALRNAEVDEVHWITREHAEQQQGMRALAEALGMQRTEHAQDEHLPYRPRRTGGREKTEEYWYGDAAAVQRAAQSKARTAVREWDLAWATGGGTQELFTKPVRKEARDMMARVHEGRGGSHAGRTWDEREVVPKQLGCSVVATKGRAGSSGTAGARATAEASHPARGTPDDAPPGRQGGTVGDDARTAAESAACAMTRDEPSAEDEECEREMDEAYGTGKETHTDAMETGNSNGGVREGSEEAARGATAHGSSGADWWEMYDDEEEGDVEREAAAWAAGARGGGEGGDGEGGGEDGERADGDEGGAGEDGGEGGGRADGDEGGKGGDGGEGGAWEDEDGGAGSEGDDGGEGGAGGDGGDGDGAGGDGGGATVWWEAYDDDEEDDGGGGGVEEGEGSDGESGGMDSDDGVDWEATGSGGGGEAGEGAREVARGVGAAQAADGGEGGGTGGAVTGGTFYVAGRSIRERVRQARQGRREEGDGAGGGVERQAEQGGPEEGARTEARGAARSSRGAATQAIGRGLHVRRQMQAASTTNVCGVRMVRRTVDGQRMQRWGDGRDLYARPGDKVRKLLRDMDADGTVLAVWTETHVSGDELGALVGYLNDKGWGVEATAGYVLHETGHTGGGVVIMWREEVFKRETRVEGYETGEVVRGRLTTARLVALACGSRVRVAGVYAPGRNGERAAEAVAGTVAGKRQRVADAVDKFWEQLEETVTEAGTILLGDLNAETEEARARYGRKERAQDARLMRMLGRPELGLCHIPVGHETWESKGVRTEIDHVIVKAAERHLWGQTETRPGVVSSDHHTVWVPFRGAAEDDDGADQRRTGRNWGKLDKSHWTAYAEAVAERVKGVACDLGAVALAAEIQRITGEEGERLWQAQVPGARPVAAAGSGASGGTSTNAQGTRSDGDGKQATAKTRQEHIEAIARWRRLEEAAAAWDGRGRLRALGKDGEWLERQPTGKQLKGQLAGQGRAQRREHLEAVCAFGRETAVEEALGMEAEAEEDAVLAKLQEAIADGATEGGAYVMLFQLLNDAKGRTVGGGAKLTALYENDDKHGREIHGAAQVREHARVLGERINVARPAAMEVVRALMAQRAGTEPPASKPRGEWVEDVCTWERFKEGLAKTTATKGVGCDGWNAYLLHKAPEAAQRRYWKALKTMVRDREFPEAWREKVAMLFMKPGEDPMELGRRRDIWLECHGLKLTMWLLGEDYERAAARSIPTSQAGSTKNRGCPEQTLVMRCQKEQAAAERGMCCRAYLDMGVFFMSCTREVQWEVEKWCGVRPEVTQVVQALYENTHGRYETAHGLTDKFALNNGNTQGCSMSPTRSKMQLRLLQETVRQLCEGYRFRGAAESTPTLFYADDGAFLTRDMHTLQLVFDTCWLVTRAAGLTMQIKGDKKTAWQASYWEHGMEKEVTGWEMKLPDGRRIPQVQRDYTYLGSAESATWENAQSAVRKEVVRKCTQMLRLIGRAGVLGERQTRVAMGLAIAGTVGFYGRATAIGMEACEEIERVRAEVLQQRGFASGGMAQMHAGQGAGGMGHAHAYQHAAAVLVDEVEKAMGTAGTPAHVAVTAHIRATCVRLGWHGYGDVREWWPAHLEREHLLDEEMIGEAWLLAKLRTGIRAQGSGTTNVPVDEGGLLWEATAEERWQPQEAEDSVCRVRVGLARTGGVAVRVRPKGGGCEMSMRTRRLAAAGIRSWADITHQEGRWLTPAEAARRYGLKAGGADRLAYEAVIGELREPRWAPALARWWAHVRGERWQAWAALRRQEGEAGAFAVVRRIVAARRTAGCLGGWEACVQWEGGWADTWESVAQLRSDGGQLKSAHVQQLASCQMHPQPASLHELLTGGARGDEGPGTTPAWKAVRMQSVQMTASEVRDAVQGQIGSREVNAALLKLWSVLREHAGDMYGDSAHAARVNMDETPRPREAVTRESVRTMYDGEAGEEQGEARSAGLGGAERAAGETVTREETQRRVRLYARLQDWADAGDVRDMPAAMANMPQTGVEELLSWEGGTGHAWKAEVKEGYGMIHSEWCRGDPLMRLLVRSPEIEAGTATVTVDGVRVEMDEAECARMTGPAADRVNEQVGSTAACLHLHHGFTDLWATDGAKKTAEEDGRMVTRAACGAYGGIACEAPALWETHQGKVERSVREVGQGMCGARLPACYEVVDTELHAMLLVLQRVGGQEAPHTRRCLIMSDSLTAVRMTEQAWRNGVTWHGPGTGRAAMLHAINAARERLGLTVIMWVPAHRGVAANAYADATAKAYMAAEMDAAAVRAAVQRDLPSGRYVQVVSVMNEWVPWFETRFTAVREATGWWVRATESAAIKAQSRAIDRERLGPTWSARAITRMEKVWEDTGAKTTRTERTGTEEAEAGEGATLLEAAEAQVERKGRHGRAQAATSAEVGADRERVGVAMAARGGGLWEHSVHSSQGCAGCCGSREGFGWVTEGEKWKWQHARSGRAATAPSAWHVLCGECEGVEAEVRDKGKADIRAGLQEARRALRKKLSRGRMSALDETQRERVVAVVDAAQRALAKGGERATALEKEAMRRFLAGDLPQAAGNETARVRVVMRRLTEAVRTAQYGAAMLRRGWHDASKKELARRVAREGGREGRRWRGVGFDVWRQWAQGDRMERARAPADAAAQRLRTALEWLAKATAKEAIEGELIATVGRLEREWNHERAQGCSGGSDGGSGEGDAGDGAATEAVGEPDGSQTGGMADGGEGGVADRGAQNATQRAAVPAGRMERELQRVLREGIAGSLGTEGVARAVRARATAWAKEMSATGGGEGCARHGWTMAGALIQYKQRQEAARARRAHAPREAADPRQGEGNGEERGRGVVVFDVETTQPIEDETDLCEMEVSVACATWLTQWKDAKETATVGTFWHERVQRGPRGGEAQPIAALLAWLDEAHTIVAYNGKRFDMQVLKPHYGGDTARWRAHMAKLTDPIEPVQRAAGRRLSLERVAALNGARTKLGCGAEAPRWWQEGRWARLEEYCARDVEVLVDLVLQPHIRVQPNVHTTAASVRQELAELEADRARGASAAAAQTHARGAVPVGHGTPAGAAATGDEGEEERLVTPGGADGDVQTPQRPRRKRTVVSYSDAAQRPRKQRRTGPRPYMERGGRLGHGTKRHAIEMGTHAVSRVVDGRYEWRDGHLAKLPRLSYAAEGARRELEARAAALRRDAERLWQWARPGDDEAWRAANEAAARADAAWATAYGEEG